MIVLMEVPDRSGSGGGSGGAQKRVVGGGNAMMQWKLMVCGGR